MAEFDVRYLDLQRQPVQARVQAADANGVAAALGLSPAALLAVEPVAAAPQKARGGRFPRRQFAQQLAVLLRAGIPLLEALQTLQSQDNPPAVTAALAGVVEIVVLVLGGRYLRIGELGEMLAVVTRRRRSRAPDTAISVSKPPLRGGKPRPGG